MRSCQPEDDTNEQQHHQQRQQANPAEASGALPTLEGARGFRLGRVFLSRIPHTATRSGTADRGSAAAARSGAR
jgi:hypothetical protein